MSETEHLSLPLATTIEDYAAFLVYATRRPRRLALHATTFVLLGLALVLLQLMIGLISAAFMPHAMTALRDFLSRGFIEELTGAMPWGVVGLVFFFGLNVFVLVPMQCRAIATRIVLGYPSRSIVDGRIVLNGRLAFDDRGVTSEMTEQRIFLSWPLIREFAETSRHIFLMTSRQNAFVIPKAGLDASTARQLTEIVGRYFQTTGR